MCERCTIIGKAEFDEFMHRDLQGRVRFENALPNQPGFQNRHWPVLRRFRSRFDLLHPRYRDIAPSICDRKAKAALEMSLRVEAARRWYPYPPLLRHTDRIEAAMMRYRPARYRH